jgi:hypothetical protein
MSVTLPRTREQIRCQIQADYSNINGGIPPEMLEEVVESEVAADWAFATAGEPPACPEWCVDEPGHRYDSHDGLVAVRIHASSLHGDWSVTQDEYNNCGEVWLGDVALRGNLDEWQSFDSAAVRKHASEALAAAELYDRIKAQA